MCMPRCNDSPRAAVSASPRSTPPSPLRSSPPALLADFSLHRQLHLLGVEFVNPNRALGRRAMRRSASALHLSSASTTSTSARPWPLRRHVHRRGRGAVATTPLPVLPAAPFITAPAAKAIASQKAVNHGNRKQAQGPTIANINFSWRVARSGDLRVT